MKIDHIDEKLNEKIITVARLRKCCYEPILKRVIELFNQRVESGAIEYFDVDGALLDIFHEVEMEFGMD